LSVGRSVRKVYCGKTAEWIGMPFGVVSWVGRGIGVLDGGGDRQRGRGSFAGEFGAAHSNQWGRRRALPKLLWEDLFLFCLKITVLLCPAAVWMVAASCGFTTASESCSHHGLTTDSVQLPWQLQKSGRKRLANLWFVSRRRLGSEG